jgi:hypothetical protein
MKPTLLILGSLVIFTLFGCKSNLQTSPQRTYKLSIVGQNSKVQFLFNESTDYSSLTSIKLPNWEGCEGMFRRGAFTDCTQKQLEQYINTQFQIPQLALDSVIEGKVGYQFQLDKEGNINNGKITKNPGGGLGEELERTLLAMPQLEPAKINADSYVATEITLEVFCDIVLR